MNTAMSSILLQAKDYSLAHKEGKIYIPENKN